MAANSVTITASAEGKTLQDLQRLIAVRQKALAETTSQAVTATAINILSSVRSQTLVCNPEKASGFVVVGQYPGVEAGFRTDGGRPIRCVRVPGGHHVNTKTINAAGRYAKGEHVDVFLVQDSVSSAVGHKIDRYYVIARSIDDAKKFAALRRKKRLEKFARMAKWTIGQAQSFISRGSQYAADRMTAVAKRTALAALQVSVNDSGFSSGSVSVDFADNLNYAALALKNGRASFDLAMQKAANKTAGLINHYIHQLRFDGPPVPTPFPEASRRK